MYLHDARQNGKLMAHSFVIIFMLNAVRIMGTDASIYFLDILFAYNTFFWLDIVIFFVKWNILISAVISYYLPTVQNVCNY